MVEIKKAGHGEYVEKKSKFLADLGPVRSAEEALSLIEQMKKKHYDARHVCSAFILMSDDGEITSRFSDDGEPSGTAGKPILDTMEGAGIVNALLTVTRYFGGTLLGTGGLVRAYSTSSKSAIEDAELAERITVYPLSVALDYAISEKGLYLMRKSEIPVLDTIYDAKVIVKAMVPTDLRDTIEKQLMELSSGAAEPEWGEMTGYLV